MTATVRLPDGGTHRLRGGTGHARPTGPSTSRVAYAAAHVVADPRAENVPGAPAAVDWDRTLAFRHHLWSYGLGVAEAMDTAQRGAGLDHPATRELIRRSAAEARAVGGRIVAGVATDQLPPGPATVPQVIRAYAEQLADVTAADARPVLMCSRHLAAAATGPDDYLRVYDELLTAADQPVVLHWLGDMFDPALAGYWGSTDLDEATETVLHLIKQHQGKVDGIKVSLLDADREVALRRRLPAGIRLYTGDDFHYPELIRGDAQGHSDALLGVFAAIAPAAAAALAALDAGDLGRYEAVFAPTLPLARHLFAAPTWFYKTGIVFLAWLAGHQEHFTMLAGQQSGRSPAHLARLLVLADDAGLLPDAELAAARARAYFTVAGVTQ
ncbi:MULTISPECIES: dihydrodipicolinate synthase family protein [unclassified Micromonospora]|uniref:dihydrodipicolinate synthase family protein n=1 Tax=unclassified Micromonospora TaxID=2617518 RepID=UPI001C5D432B|nr:dihydrodipicolinate synthase family protein [Micromonospora sp. RL09-050-HVF-A]MBW4701432.1 dihydrodipicolinate synthase family protein [Micromonospora sp. RL09-050-HVF-A]